MISATSAIVGIPPIVFETSKICCIFGSSKIFVFLKTSIAEKLRQFHFFIVGGICLETVICLIGHVSPSIPYKSTRYGYSENSLQYLIKLTNSVPPTEVPIPAYGGARLIRNL